MLTFLLLGLSTLTLAKTELASGDYGVKVKDRAGNVHHCTLEIQNNITEQYLVLNINDCPPPVKDIALFYFDDEGVYLSDKIEADTRRGGFKVYEIEAKSSTKFIMTSYREYGDGGVAKPRKVQAILK
jgi:hypothetical protein